MSATASTPCLGKPLSRDQCLRYERQAKVAMKRTLDQYLDHIRLQPHDRRVDPGRWELTKTRGDVSIFKSRDGLQPNVFAEATRGPVGEIDRLAPLTALLCVGSFVGSIEDAMYGAATPTEMTMATRSLLIEDEFEEHRVFQDIKKPTVENPFEYVGLKWSLRKSRVPGVVRRRDLVYVEADGFHEFARRGKQERVGYTVCHSVDVPDLPSTEKSNGTVRTRFSMCSIFRQMSSNTVDVYITVITDPAGSLPSALAVKSASGALVAASRVMECALNKKLSWMLRHNSTLACPADKRSERSCNNCARTLSALNSHSSCGICLSPVCSRCLRSSQLVLGDKPSELTLQSIPVCHSCVSKANRSVKTNQIAAREYGISRRRSTTMLSRVERHTQLPSVTKDVDLRSQTINMDRVHTAAEQLLHQRQINRSFVVPQREPEFSRSELKKPEKVVFARVERFSRPVARSESLQIFDRLTALQRQAEETQRMLSQQTRSLEIERRRRYT